MRGLVLILGFSPLVAVVWQKLDPLLEFEAADGPSGQNRLAKIGAMKSELLFT